MTEIVLGLGSSLGNRCNNLRRALGLLEKISGLSVRQVSPLYVSDALMPEDAPSDWNAPYLNLAIRCETTLSPEALLPLLKQTEKKAGRLPEKKWGPRIIDIDILAFGQQVCHHAHLHIPHEHLASRPFALWPLADVAPEWNHPELSLFAEEMVAPWGSRFSGKAPFRTRQIAQRIDTPQLAGILNLTPDSFSGDGLSAQVDTMLKQAESMVEQGAVILDVGAEATHPSAIPVTPQAEWQRLELFLPALLHARHHFVIQPEISIDTRHPETAKKALALGCDWINDVSGLDNPAMKKAIADSGCRVVIMHHLGIPARREITLPIGTDPVSTLLQWGEKRIEEALSAGILRENIIFDPGAGFGKTAAQTLTLMKNMSRFHELGVPLLAGHSRKSFMNPLTPHPACERDPETAAISLQLSMQKVDYLRIHNPDIHSRLWRMLQGSWPKSADSV